MSDRAPFELLSKLATLQRRHSGGVILVASNRSGAWIDSRPEARMDVDPAILRELVAQGLVMVEPYDEARPRGVQILGMTSNGWKLAARTAGAAAQTRPAA
jgi:hypothetical protein